MNILPLSFVVFLISIKEVTCQSLEEVSSLLSSNEKLVDENVEVFKEDFVVSTVNQNQFVKRPRKTGANSKYPICSYEDTNFLGADINILNSLETDSAGPSRDNNCFLIESGKGRTPNNVFLDRDYISGTRRNNCKCLRRTDFIEVENEPDTDIGSDARRRRRRRRNRPKICPRGVKESDDIDYTYDDYEEFNENLKKKSQNSTMSGA
ncbi:unnamed protein product [Lepeophtheirus salmonis]|uniref:(salmon louse) hypothetical protein n=1 Tax=Lepeophtheirus salmonis TaxID=72036 RepID=A0A7R8CG51_LEPSM|nr:unnamed protein product [Lepeophtheirus salmonis]CAF2765948.1 unnamed protein product [Lepeophtheirus salmonis]